MKQIQSWLKSFIVLTLKIKHESKRKKAAYPRLLNVTFVLTLCAQSRNRTPAVQRAIGKVQPPSVVFQLKKL